MLHSLLNFDRALYWWIVTHRFGAIDRVMWALSIVGRGGMVWLIVGAVLAIAKRLAPISLLPLVLAIALAMFTADYGMKPLVNRERPFTAVAAVHVIGGRPHDASFPSGHAANAFAGALVLSRLAPGARIAWWTIAVAVACSRVYLGVHYPFDVLAGALVGLASGALVMKVTHPRMLRQRH